MTFDQISYLVIFCMVVGGGGAMFMFGWLVGDTMGYAKAVHEWEDRDPFSIDYSYEDELGKEEPICR